MIIYYAGNTVVRPGDAILLSGEGLDEATALSVGRLSDARENDAPGYIAVNTPVSVPTEAELREAQKPLAGESAVCVSILQQNRHSLKFILPDEMAQGVFAVTLSLQGGGAQTVYLNAPSVKWTQGDMGPAATPGGWLRLNGEKLLLDDADGSVPTVIFERDGVYTRMAEVRVCDLYSVEVKIPEGMETGAYRAFVHNGFGGATAWSCPAAARVERAAARPETVFDVRAYGADNLGEEDSTQAFRAALAAAGEHGGGVVFVPRGRYWLTDTIHIPNFVTLRGESLTRSQIFWTPFRWEFGKLPAGLVTADSDVTVEELDFRGTRVASLFVIGEHDPHAKNIVLRHIRASFNAFAGGEFHITEPENRLKIIHEIFKVEAMLVRIAGENVQILDSEFANTGMSFGPIGRREKRYFLFRGNVVKERLSGWAYFARCEQAIIEKNEFNGCTVGFGGTRIYFGNNVIHDVLNNDREAFTTDMSYSTMSTHPVRVEGTRVTLPEGIRVVEDRVNLGGLYVNAGKGLGQARCVVAREGNVLELDAPFACDPDAESEICLGGTCRTAYYFVNNTVENAGHIQFYCDQCSSVYDRNLTRRAAGLMVYSWQEDYKKDNPGALPLWTRTENHFVSMINNRLEDGNYLHKYGRSEEGYRDGWSGFASIGANVGGATPNCNGLLLRGNELQDDAFISIRGRYNSPTGPGYATDFIADNNRVHDSEYGLKVECELVRPLIRRNDFSENVTHPMIGVGDAQ